VLFEEGKPPPASGACPSSNAGTTSSNGHRALPAGIPDRSVHHFLLQELVAAGVVLCCWSFWRFFLVANELNRFRALGLSFQVRFAQHLRPVFLRQRRCRFSSGRWVSLFSCSRCCSAVCLWRSSTGAF
jgi:hypothetical protein